MNKKDRVKAITTLSLADLLFQYDGETNFKSFQKKYEGFKSKTRQIIFKQHKKDAKIASLGHKHACRIAEAIADHDGEYIPTYCALNVLSDSRKELEQLPTGMKVDFMLVGQLAEMIAISNESTVELLRGSTRLDGRISEMISEIG